MHRPSLADGRTGGNELLKKAKAPHVGCLDVSSDSIQIFCNEISRRIFGPDFFCFCPRAKIKYRRHLVGPNEARTLGIKIML